eukprot:8662596-Alexandrium_andersonii.AAC.1
MLAVFTVCMLQAAFAHTRARAVRGRRPAPPGGGADGGSRNSRGRDPPCSGTLVRHTALGPPKGPAGDGRSSI